MRERGEGRGPAFIKRSGEGRKHFVLCVIVFKDVHKIVLCELCVCSMCQHWSHCEGYELSLCAYVCVFVFVCARECVHNQHLT